MPLSAEGTKLKSQEKHYPTSASKTRFLKRSKCFVNFVTTIAYILRRRISLLAGDGTEKVQFAESTREDSSIHMSKWLKEDD